MLLGGIVKGEEALDAIASRAPRRTIAGYIEERIRSPYLSPRIGAQYLLQVCQINAEIPDNLFLVVGDEELEVQASRVSNATNPGPADAWRLVHGWISDLIADIRASWNVPDSTVFIDCNPSFTVYTELAMSASDRLIIPFSADGSSKRAVRAVLSLLYGTARTRGARAAGGRNESLSASCTLGKSCSWLGAYSWRSGGDRAAAVPPPPRWQPCLPGVRRP